MLVTFASRQCCRARRVTSPHVTARVSCGGGSEGDCASLWFALEIKSATKEWEKARAKFEPMRTSMRNAKKVACIQWGAKFTMQEVQHSQTNHYAIASHLKTTPTRQSIICIEKIDIKSY